tara:strand:+ start:83295 stop:83621 length:327 start_codon:yes stop_codon:yes gene_type:complete
MEKSERDYIEAYQKKGYDCEFRMVKGSLIELKTKRTYRPKDINIVAEHRFEGMSNPSDMSILYIIETNDHSKGNVLAGYGPSNNSELTEFFAKIPIEQCSNIVNINNQ